MKHRTPVSVLVILIAALSLVASVIGLLPGSGEAHEVTTFRGTTVTLSGSGLYAYDSVGSAAQAKGQDFITLILALPLLIISLVFMLKGSTKGRLLPRLTHEKNQIESKRIWKRKSSS